jgi:nicotinate-nucleotide pyrophosphorylase (carboxylating)
MLERYAVLLGGGRNSRFGLDDGVLITANHIAVAGGLTLALRNAKAKLGHAQKIQVQVSTENEMKTAVDLGADVLLLQNLSPTEVGKLITAGRQLSPSLSFECSGNITVADVRVYADAGPNVISISPLQASPAAMDVSFMIQPF